MSAVDGSVKYEPLPPRSFLRLLNILEKVVSLDVLKSLFTYIFSNLSLDAHMSGSENMPFIFVTWEVLKLERLSVVRLDILKNIYLISVTLEVSKLERSSVVRLDILLNILLIFVTLEVLKLERSIVVRRTI